MVVLWHKHDGDVSLLVSVSTSLLMVMVTMVMSHLVSVSSRWR